MSIELKPDENESALRFVGRLFLDPYFAMIGFGAVGHQLGLPYLFKLGYWESWMICFTLQALWPIHPYAKYKVGWKK